MSEISSEPRAKRTRLDKSGRFAALEKLRNLKGHKNKYKVEEEVDNVYEIVDEREYAKKAREKYGDDWIDDDGTGYAEDGRDFFEDEDDYSDSDVAPATNSAKAAKKRARDEKKSVKSKGSIRNLFKNVVPKKSATVKLDEDDILADILGEMKEGGTTSTSSTSNVNKVIAPARIVSANHALTSTKKSQDTEAKEYMNNFAKTVPKKKDTSKAAVAAASSVEDSASSTERVLSEPKQQQKSVEKEKKAAVTEIVRVEESITGSAIKPKIFTNSADFEMDDDMDFSCLKDAENQFEIEKPKVESAKVPTPIPTPTPIKTNASKKEIETPAAAAKKPEKKSTNNADDLQSLLSNWENICQMDSFDEEVENANTNAAAGTAAKKKLPDELKFWYWEAWESPKILPGEVFLFGKTAEGESITVRVKNIDRVLYLLPREYLLDPITWQSTKEKVTLKDIYNEFNDDISVELKLENFRSRKVTKKFAYHSIGIDVPEECDYMEIHYDGKKPAPNPKRKYRSIAHIFGVNTTSLECFLLDRKIKGPCWLTLKKYNANPSPSTWSKVEVTVSNPRDVVHTEAKVLPPPPSLTLLTLNVRTAINPRSMRNEICMISMLVHNRFHIDKKAPEPPFNRHMCALTRPTSRTWPFDLSAQLAKFRGTKVIKHDTERALLGWFLAQYQQIDADLIVTFDMEDCQLNVIADRILALKLPQWSRLGRLRMSDHTHTKYVMEYFLGRMVCDVRHSAEECIRSRSYDLQTLCQNVLKLDENARAELNVEDIAGMYESGEGIIKLITLTMQDAAYILRMMYELNLMPLALQITNICGNIMNRTLQKGRNERNEFLLLHAFTEKNYIVPEKKLREYNNDKSTNNSIADASSSSTQDTTTTNNARKKAAYAGGLVLDPIKGLYDTYVLLMDFNSLYPSIIQEYNICFTTVQQPYDPDDLPTLPKTGTEPGILPQQLRRLVESRREVKKLMASPDVTPEKYQQYNIRQMALKLTANSMYGCLGFGASRFFAQHLAALVTFKGREILTNTKSLVEKMNYNVVYGDTDSIMVNTNITDYDQVFKIGNGIKQSINKVYKQLEIDIDGVFSCLLLLKKKKYAAVKVFKNKKGELQKEQEHKGLDIVRRDWSQVAVMVGKYVLDEILAEKPLEEKLDAVHTKLEEIKDNITNGVVPLSMFVITKQLSKGPTEFNNPTSMPHVQVALRMNQTRNRRYKKGDMVDYIICDDGTKNPPTQRAYHLDELKTSETLKLDNHYYLSHQIHPVVTRMVEVLDGTDAARIAECLGLDSTKYRHAVQKSYEERSEDFVGEAIIKTALQKYRLCEKFKFVCISCKAENMVASAFRPNQQTHEAVLEKCCNPDCNTAPYQYVVAIRNQLILKMRSHIKRFYQNWLVCDNPVCNQNTRFCTHVVSDNWPICHYCKNGTLIRQYSEHDLYNQLKYYKYMFDLSTHQHKNVQLIPDVETAFNVLRETVEQQLQKSAYSTISGAKLFLRLRPETDAAAKNMKPVLLTVPTTIED